MRVSKMRVREQEEHERSTEKGGKSRPISEDPRRAGSYGLRSHSSNLLNSENRRNSGGRKKKSLGRLLQATKSR